MVSALLLALALACAPAEGNGQREPVIGGPCEGCELVFEGMPGEMGWAARIAPPEEPGEPLVIEGVVTDAEGRPAEGVIVYAYHTDASGIYPPASTRHGRLRGWVRTDGEGRYRFETIRPGAYPGGTEPQHVHMHVIEPGRATYWIDSIHFRDDPLLSEERIRVEAEGRGGRAMVDPERGEDGLWRVRRDIVLGKGIPGHRR